MKKLNIACGSRYHPEWENIDFHPTSKFVKKVNVLKGLPYKDNTFDIVYCSHFLEHLSLKQAEFFLSEVYRILKPEGIFRVVVPDLENICREYIRILDELKDNENDFLIFQHEWIIIELIDQLVRTQSGGVMLEVYNLIQKQRDKEKANYIKERVGENLLYNELKQNKEKNFKNYIKKFLNKDKILNKLLYLYLKLLKILIPSGIRDYVFIQTSIGERHLWMYDRYSLERFLKKIGFKKVFNQNFNTSLIPDFNSYYLDINPDGSPYKGVSSLYLEAVK